MTSTTFEISSEDATLQLSKSNRALGQYELKVDGVDPPSRVIFLSAEQLNELKVWIESN